MSEQRRAWTRPLPWVLGGTLVLLAALALVWVADARAAAERRARDQLERRLAEVIEDWEQRLLGAMDDAVTGAPLPDDARERQDRLRQRWPWFDALYTWETGRGSRGRDTARITWPLAPTVERPEVLSRVPCLESGRSAAQSSADPDAIAAIWLATCASAPEAIRLVAVTEAAATLALADKHEGALAILDRADPDGGRDLRTAARIGLPPYRLAALRNQRAASLAALGRGPEAAAVALRNGLDMTNLDAPDAGPLLHLVRYPALSWLRREGAMSDADRLESALMTAERRVAAWREVSARVVADPPSGPSTPVPRWSWDQYSTDPFVLYTVWSVDGSGAAAQLEQKALLAELSAARGLAAWRPHLVISDDRGAIVAGSRRGGEVVVSVDLPRTLHWIRVGLREAAIEAEVAEATRLAWVPLVIVLAALGLGLSALFAQTRAVAQEHALLQRQRDFSTRVTHELKTPLAGMKIMAENLEIGAFKDSAHRAEMASRIAAEVDRLTTRIDEVLSVAREARVPDPQEFDPEEAVLGALEMWAARLEAASVALVADEVHATDRILGDGRAVRDAVGCLLDNALKYRRRDISDATVWVELRPQPGAVEIRIIDNGLGVPVAQREAIFEPWVRVEGEQRGDAGGYGLGLAQVRQVAVSHGGDVRCEDGRDGGIAFVLRLPTVPTATMG